MRPTPEFSWAIFLATMTGLAAVSRSARLHCPLESVSSVVASFGEYRPDHLHPGVDLSTGGRTGLPVLAAAEGAIYRLKVEWRGYGKAIYLRHKDGKISVYAHLERFEENGLRLETRVEEAKKTSGMRYPGDIYLNPPVPVRRGQRIATSGESGAGLPHLHFELRRDEQQPCDPSPALPRLPEVPALRLEALILRAKEAGALVQGKRIIEVPLSRDKAGVYVPQESLVVTGSFLPEVRIVAEDAGGHRTGIRGLSVKLDGTPVYRFLLEAFRFDQYPQVGLLLDHARTRLSPSVFTYRLSRLPGNDLGRQVPATEVLWPSLIAGRHLLEAEVTGAFGNSARARIPFQAFSPPRLHWQEVPEESGRPLRLTLRLGTPIGEEGSNSPIIYTSVGGETPLACGDRAPLPDGETCTFLLPSGGRGITATLLMAGSPVARTTHILPRPLDRPPLLPPIRVTPGPEFVDLEIPVPRAAELLPSKLILRTEKGETPLQLEERETGLLVASVPLEVWQETSGVDVEWEALPHALRAASPLAIHVGTPAASQRFEDCGMQMDFPTGSFFSPTPLACAIFDGPLPRVQGLDLRSPVVQMLPEGIPLSHKASVRFSVGARTEYRRLGIYRLDVFRGKWVFLGGDPTELGVSVQVGRFETLALLEDLAPPRILGVEPPLERGRLDPRPRFVIRVEDEGSGLNFDGVHLQVDGNEMELEYDPDREWSTGTPAAPLSAGDHIVSLWAEDRAGNRTPDATFRVQVP